MAEKLNRPRYSKRSLSVQAMGKVDAITKAVVPPIHISTTISAMPTTVIPPALYMAAPTMKPCAKRKP